MSYEKRVKVVLHGYLKKLYDGELNLTGFSVAEIINGMCKSTKAFNVGRAEDKHLIKVVGYESYDSLFEPLGADVTELHLVPEMCGGKGGGFLQVALGAVFIAASFVPGLNVAIWAGAAATWSGVLFSLGLSLALGGLLQLISPSPKATGTGDKDPEASKYLGANQNTTKIGTRIPLLYGKVLAYGQYLSFNVDAKDVAT